MTIERLGQRGEGVAHSDEGAVFTPYALPGDRIIAEVDGERGRLVEVIEASPDRIAPFCPLYGECGGCAVQALAAPAYAQWKRGLLVEALDYARLQTEIPALVDAHGEGRRRATFHARVHRDALGKTRIDCGFMRTRAHDIVNIETCPVLSPGMAAAPALARDVAMTLAPLGKPLDIVVTDTLEGLDVDIRGTGPVDAGGSRALTELANARDYCARISIHGEALIERRAPILAMGRAHVVPPPGAFLQATLAGEETLARLVRDAVGDARKIADLFAGVGTFALRLAENAEVHAVESEAAAIAALQRAANNAPGLRSVTTERRDLNRRPLTADELGRFNAVVFDPPRAGAQAQSEALAQSGIATVVAVSCNVATFARDAKALVAGGYVFERATPVDQFRHSPHVEIVGVFRRTPASRKARRSVLG